MEPNEKKLTEFNHDKAGVSDKIALLAELEHIQRHAIRSAVSLYNPDESDKLDWVRYATTAKEAKDLRRKLQKEYFNDISDYDWCLCKSAACLRQLAYETFSGDVEKLKEIDDLVDEIWGEALDMDLSDCEACRSDRPTELE